MRVAFWNINLGEGSFSAKQDAFRTWCEAVPPDLLFLEEVSATQTADNWANLTSKTGMDALNNVATLDVNGNASTKQLAALVKKGNPSKFASQAVRIPKLVSIRMALKVTHPDTGLQVYGIHANASQSGGSAANEAVTDLLANATKVVVGGDYNFPAAKATHPIVSLRFDRQPLTVSQWNSEGSSIDKAQQAHDFGFTQNYAVAKSLKANPNGVIDFALASAGVTVTPVRAP